MSLPGVSRDVVTTIGSITALARSGATTGVNAARESSSSAISAIVPSVASGAMVFWFTGHMRVGMPEKPPPCEPASASACVYCRTLRATAAATSQMPRPHK